MDDLENVSIKSTDRSLAIFGLIAGAVPFMISVSSSSSVTMNGQVVSSSYRDTVAIGGGALAAICGLIAVVLAVRGKSGGARIGLAVAALALGGYQLARGFGVFAGTGSGGRSHIETVHVQPTPVPVDTSPAHCPDGDACNKQGLELEKAKDFAGALAAYTHGCELDEKVDCYNAGLFWKNGKVGAMDGTKAMALFEKGCKLGDGDACLEEGMLHAKPADSGTKDMAKALAAFDRACAVKEAHGCFNVGILYRDGDGVAADPKQAFAMFSKACDGEDLDGCHEVGVAYALGNGVEKDPKQAVPIFEKGCKAGNVSSCFSIAVLTADGEGIKKDLKRARELYTDLCDHDSFVACTNLGLLFFNGKGGPKDKTKAAELLQKGCDGGVEIACTDLVRFKLKKK
jgi:uncharacterized protein